MVALFVNFLDMFLIRDNFLLKKSDLLFIAFALDIEFVTDFPELFIFHFDHTLSLMLFSR